MPTINEHWHFKKLSAAQFTAPENSIGNNAVNAGDPLDADKVQHNRSLNVELAEGAAAIVAINKLLFVARSDCTILEFTGTIVVQATGGDRTVSIDLQKSTGGGAFATICTTPVQITNATTILVPVAAVLASATLVAGDLLRAVVTVAGAAGNQAKGLLINLSIDEDYA